jgi:hypothetical protein
LSVVIIVLTLYLKTGRSTGCLDNQSVTRINLYKDHQQLTAKFHDDTLMNEINQKLMEWWSSADRGWKPNFVTFLPSFTFEMGNGSLNILGQTAVVGCPAGTFKRELMESEIEVFQELKSSVPEWSSN